MVKFLNYSPYGKLSHPIIGDKLGHILTWLSPKSFLTNRGHWGLGTFSPQNIGVAIHIGETLKGLGNITPGNIFREENSPPRGEKQLPWGQKRFPTHK